MTLRIHRVLLFRCSPKELMLPLNPDCVAPMDAMVMTDAFCGLLDDPLGVFGPCMAVLNNLYLDNCVFDVCMNQGDLDNAKAAACGSLEAFNLECSEIGLGADWRLIAGCGT